MRLSLLVGSWVSLSVLYGQQPGMYGGISTGRIVGSVTDPGFAGRLGATVSGLPQTSGAAISGPYLGSGPRGSGFGGGGGGARWRGGPNRTVVVPFGVPVYYGGGFGGYPDGAMPAPAVVQPMQPAPSVIINQYYTPETVRPQMREYTDLPEPAAPDRTESPVRVYPPPQRQEPAPAPAGQTPAEDPKATITLLAFHDSSVVAAIGYWTQGDQLHYVTSAFAKKTAPVSTLDKELTGQLNRERNVEFKLESLR